MKLLFSIKNAVIWISTGICVVGTFLYLHQIMRSSMFLVRSVVVTSSQDDPPLSDSDILEKTGIVLGGSRLFELDIQQVERSLLSEDSVQEVKIQKKIPNELDISVIYKVPRAMLQVSKKSFVYLDASGRVFGQVRMDRICDLPLLIGFNPQDIIKFRDVVRWVTRWENSKLGALALISSVQWNIEHGYQATIVYPLSDRTQTRARTMIDIGQDITSNLDDKLSQLLSVLQYLRKNSIAASQIFADIGEKIVVKTRIDSWESEKGES